ncbi:MAG: glycosyltransferase [Candidatus Nitrosocosmicus sp.]
MYLRYSLKHSPKLEPQFSKIKQQNNNTNNNNNITNDTFPKISVIVPARNEEMYISKCIDSLINQDYSGSLEIIAVNDCSTDKTSEIIQTYSHSLQNCLPGTVSWRNSKSAISLKAIYIDNKPDGWMGKNWSCYQGYLNSTGQLLLFIDADTIMTSPSTLSLSTNELLRNDLDAITLRPHLIYENNLWLKITIPIMWTISHLAYSALRINDPARRKNGFVFGCFYLITRKAYEMIGTHKVIKNEIAEDLEIGKLIKEKVIIKDEIKIENTEKFNLQYMKLKMILGERYIDSVLIKTGGGLDGLWNLIQRTTSPLYNKDKKKTLITAFSMAFLMMYPLAIFLFSLSFVFLTFSFEGYFNSQMENSNILLNLILLTESVILFVIVVLTNVIISKKSLFQNPSYALLAPLGSLIISAAMISAINIAIKNCAIYWKDRKIVYP